MFKINNWLSVSVFMAATHYCLSHTLQYAASRLYMHAELCCASLFPDVGIRDNHMQN